MNVACYVRVSTAEQNLDRQLRSPTDYATDDLDADLANVNTYRDKSTGTEHAPRRFHAVVDDKRRRHRGRSATGPGRLTP